MKDKIEGVFEFKEWKWQGKEPVPYKTYQKTGFRGIKKVVLAGDNPDEQIKFEVRYFEIEEGGYSSLERHEHEHVVIVMRGKGKVLIGEKVYEVKPYDLIRIKGGTLHRLLNESREPFGFLCIVDRDRDRPQYPDRGELEELLKRLPDLKKVVNP